MSRSQSKLKLHVIYIPAAHPPNIVDDERDIQTTLGGALVLKDRWQNARMKHPKRDLPD